MEDQDDLGFGPSLEPEGQHRGLNGNGCQGDEIVAVQQGIFGLVDEQEDIKVHLVPRTVAMQLLEQQKIDNAASVIALQWLALNLDKVKHAWGA